MPRVALIDPDARPELATLAARIRGARRGSVIKVYKALMHAPALAQTWFEHNNAVRWKTHLSARLRELVIIRIAHLMGCAYVLGQHVPALAEPEGVTAEQSAALADWQPSAFFDALERAALAYADAMTRGASVPDDVVAEVRRHFDEPAFVELTVLIGTYNMQTRVIGALGLEPESAG